MGEGRMFRLDFFMIVKGYSWIFSRETEESSNSAYDGWGNCRTVIGKSNTDLTSSKWKLVDPVPRRGLPGDRVRPPPSLFPGNEGWLDASRFAAGPVGTFLDPRFEQGDLIIGQAVTDRRHGLLGSGIFLDEREYPARIRITRNNHAALHGAFPGFKVGPGREDLAVVADRAVVGENGTDALREAHPHLLRVRLGLVCRLPGRGIIGFDRPAAGEKSETGEAAED